MKRELSALQAQPADERRSVPALANPPGSASPAGRVPLPPTAERYPEVNKDDWKAFLRWLESADSAELERKLLALETRAATFTEEAVRADARRLLAWINVELEARRAVRGSG